MIVIMTFRGKRCWEKFEQWKSALPEKPHILAYGLWRSREGKRLLYIEAEFDCARP